MFLKIEFRNDEIWRFLKTKLGNEIEEDSRLKTQQKNS